MNKSIKFIFNYILGIILFVVLCWNLFIQIKSQPDINIQWQNIKESWKSYSIWIVFLLMFLNYGIEAKKWKILISHLQKISFKTAIKSVFAGCSITMLTPNRIGEYGGRILFIAPEHRLAAISVTVLGSLSQLMVTLFAGTAGLIIIKYSNFYSGNFQHLPWLIENVLLIVSLLACVISTLLYFHLSWVVKKISNYRIFNKVLKYLIVLNDFSGQQLIRIVLLSFVRYLVFILQYIIMLYLMNVQIDMFLCFWILSIFFLILAFAPTIGFIDLPLRAFAAVALFKIYSENIAGIQAASFGIWIINLIIPAFIGSFLILGIKFLKQNE